MGSNVDGFGGGVKPPGQIGAKTLPDRSDARGVVDYALSHILSQLITVVGVFEFAGGLGMADKAQLEEGSRASDIAEDGEPGPFETTVSLGKPSDQTILKVVSEEGVPRVVAIGFRM